MTTQIIKREGKNFIVDFCPKCSAPLRERPSRFGPWTRLILIILLVPLLYVVVVLITHRFFFLIPLAAGLPYLLFNSYSYYNSPSAVVEELQTEDLAARKNKLKLKIISVIFVVILPSLILTFFQMKKFYTLGSARKKTEAIEFGIYPIGQSLAIHLEGRYALSAGLPSGSVYPSPEEFYRDFDGEYKLSRLLLAVSPAGYLGRELSKEDFKYETDGKTYRLCLDVSDLHRCWISNRGGEPIVE